MEKLIASWRSVEPKKNRFRFYAISVGRDLWGDEVLIKRWGRIGCRKQENYFWPDGYRDLMNMIEDIKETREKHGYRLERGVMAN